MPSSRTRSVAEDLTRNLSSLTAAGAPEYVSRRIRDVPRPTENEKTPSAPVVATLVATGAALDVWRSSSATCAPPTGAPSGRRRRPRITTRRAYPAVSVERRLAAKAAVSRALLTSAADADSGVAFTTVMAVDACATCSLPAASVATSETGYVGLLLFPWVGDVG